MYCLCWLTKTVRDDIDIIAEDVAVTPAFVDSHCHIGMATLEEPQHESESNRHMDSVLPKINPYTVYTRMILLLVTMLKSVFYSIIFLVVKA